MEMQRHTQLMYTSCGWFFDDISGIETVQIMAYAARALRLAADIFGLNCALLEWQFVERLRQAKSNSPPWKDGGDIYRHLVKPMEVNLEQVAAHYAISSVFGSYPEETVLFCYTIRRLDYENVTSGRARLAIGRCRITSNLTEETEEISFAALHFGDHNVTAAVERSTPQDLSAFNDLKQKCSAAVTQANLPEVVRLIDSFFGGSPYSLASLFKDDQRRILRFILNATLSEVEDSLVKIYEEHASLLHFLNASGLPKPPALTMAAGFAINAGLRRALEDEPIDLARVRSLISLAKSDGVVLETHALRYLTDQHMKRAMVQLHAKPLEPGRPRPRAHPGSHAARAALRAQSMAGAKHLVRHADQVQSLPAGLGCLGRGGLEGELPRVGPSAFDRGGAISGGRRVAGRARDECLAGNCALAPEGHGPLSSAHSRPPMDGWPISRSFFARCAIPLLLPCHSRFI